MAFAAQRFETSGFESKRRVIDISGDGRTNDGPPGRAGARQAGGAGHRDQRPAVMMNRTNFRPPTRHRPRQVLRGNVIGGPGSFMISAESFDDFGRAVRSKLIREISNVSTPRATPS
jgi:hypothetical protein